MSALLVGPVKDKFISEGSNLILQNTAASNTIKGEPQIFTSSMESIIILSWIRLVFWEYFHQDDTATSLPWCL